MLYELEQFQWNVYPILSNLINFELTKWFLLLKNKGRFLAFYNWMNFFFRKSCSINDSGKSNESIKVLIFSLMFRFSHIFTLKNFKVQTKFTVWRKTTSIIVEPTIANYCFFLTIFSPKLVVKRAILYFKLATSLKLSQNYFWLYKMRLQNLPKFILALSEYTFDGIQEKWKIIFFFLQIFPIQVSKRISVNKPLFLHSNVPEWLAMCAQRK